MNITALVGSHQPEQLSGNIFMVANALLCVINDYLLKTAPSLVITISCRGSSSCNYYRDVLLELFRKWKNTTKTLQIVDVGRSSRQHVPGQRHRNLILIDSYQAFLDMDIVTLTRMNTFNELNYIIVNVPHYLMELQLQQILKYCWTHDIINCSVQVEGVDGEVLVYTYFPFTSAHHCGNAKPVLINQFNGEEFINAELFPKKLRNFYGCPLRVAVWNAPPFMYLLTEIGATSISGGIEGRLLQTLAKRLNFSVQLKVPPNQNENGIEIANKASMAMLMLQNHSVEFSLGAYRQSTDRDIVASYSLSYYQSKQVFSVIVAAYDLTSWQLLIFPFNINSWLMIFITLIAVILKVSLSKLLYKRYFKFLIKSSPKYEYLNVFATFTGMPPINMPNYTHARVLLMNWLFFTLIIRTLYQALLFSLIHTRVHNSLPETLDDIVNAQLTAVMTQRTNVALQEFSVIQRLPKLIINASSESGSLECIKEIHSKHYVAIAPQEYVLLHAHSSEERGTFEILPTYLITFDITMYMTKHSFLINQFNEELDKIRVAGFIELWRRWELDDKILRDTSQDEEQVFTLNQLYMIFVLHIMGLLMAFMAFMFELRGESVKILKKLFDMV